MYKPKINHSTYYYIIIFAVNTHYTMMPNNDQKTLKGKKIMLLL